MKPKNTLNYFLILPCFYLCFSSLAVAQSSSSIGLLEVYQSALQQDQQLKAANEDRRALSSTAKLSGAALLPSISLSASYASTTSTLTPYGNSSNIEVTSGALNTLVSLNMPLIDVSLWKQKKAGAHLQDQADYLFKYQEQAFLYRVVTYYLNFLSALDRLESSTAREKSLEKQLEQVSQRYAIGISTINDREEAQAGLDGAIALRIRQQLERERAKWQLYELANIEVNSVVTLCKENNFNVNFSNEQARQLRERASKKNSLLLASESSVGRLHQMAKAASAQRYPKLSLGLISSLEDTSSIDTNPAAFLSSYQAISYEQTGVNQLSLSLSVPLFTGGALTHSSNKAWSEYRAAKARLKHDARSLQARVRTALFAVKASQAGVDAAEQALKSAELALKATQSGYDNGIRNVVDLVRSAESYYHNLSEYKVSRYQYIVAVLGLHLETGDLGYEHIEWVDSLLAYSENDCS